MRDTDATFLSSSSNNGHSNLTAHFLSEGEQTSKDIAQMFADFISGAQTSLNIAIYDFRLSPAVRSIIELALEERRAAGVTIRIVYDADKPEQPHLLQGMDPAPSGTGSFVHSLGYPFRRISGMKLMHQKYMVRDAGLPSACVWTGSANFTDDSWQFCENNIVRIVSPELASYYERDFEDLWRTEQIEHTGAFDTQPASLVYEGTATSAQVLFSPGRGEVIDSLIADRVRNARHRVRICSMLITSGALIDALEGLLATGDIVIDGIYDRTQMEQVFQQWQEVPHNHWKIPAVQRIIANAHLVGKDSTPYSPNTRHDFMHNKVLVIDNTVITGSYNFSHSAELNAENILLIDSAPFADTYSRYIDHLKVKYGRVQLP